MRKTHPLIKIINNSLIDLPTPMNISLWWNMGSLTGLCLIIQIITGLLLVFFYCPNIELAFNSASDICQNSDKGWVTRYMHANGASMFFFCIYLHIGRGLYYQSYKYKETWSIGIVLLLLTMGTAFLGYVLPWGQMSYWGASVITNLLTVTPFLGKEIVSWIWGGFSVNNITLTRFFTLHFLLPFMILGVTMIHLLFLHQTGSNNPLGLNSNKFKIPFHPYFTLKDCMGFIVLITLLIILIAFSPDLLGEPDNFILANPLVTPIHIQPEWYFLFAYAILRSIPNKMGGVIALLMSIMILFFMPLNIKNKFQGTQFYPPMKILFWIFSSTLLILTWIGMRPVETPYLVIGQMFSILYFSIYLIMPLILYKWDSMLN